GELRDGSIGSAAWLWDLLQSRPGTLHVTCPGPRHGKRAFDTHQADLPAADRTVRDGIPVASLARTILDISVASRPRTVGRYRPKRKFTRSGFERRFLDLVRDAGLPEPAMNAFVAGLELDAY